MARRNPGKGDAASAWIPLQVFILLLSGFIVYWPALRGGWLWDDDMLVTENALVHDPAGWWKIWLQPAQLIDFFPLKVEVEWIEWHLFDRETLGYHLVTFALHLIGALLLWRLFARLGLRWAWFGALLFTVHPAVVESVAWIAELKNTLSLPFFLLAALAWIKFDAHHRRVDYLAALGCFVAAMLCKSSMVMFPAVLLLYAWYRHGRITRREILASVPFFAVSLALGVVTWYFMHRIAVHHPPVFTGGILARVALAGLIIASYFGLALYPVGLMPIYPHWKVDPPTALQFLPWIFIIGVLAICWQWRRGWGRPALFGIGYFLLMLAPFVGTFSGSYMRLTWVMDHIIYLPLIGLAGLAAAGIELVHRGATIAVRPLVSATAVALLVFLALVSFSYAKIYVSSDVYWTYSIEKNPAAWIGYNNRGLGYLHGHDYARAGIDLDRAIELEPDYTDALTNNGQLKFLQGNFAGAATLLDRAIQTDSNHPLALLVRGLNRIAQGGDANYLGAILDLQHYREVATGNPNADYAALWIWVAQTRQGQRQQADHDLDAALAIGWNAAPNAWVTQNAHFLLGKFDETAYLAIAPSLDPKTDSAHHCEAWFYLGAKKQAGGDPMGATEAFARCLKTNETDFYEYILAKSANPLHVKTH